MLIVIVVVTVTVCFSETFGKNSCVVVTFTIISK